MKKVRRQGGAFRRRIRQAARGRSRGARSGCVVGSCEVGGENSCGRRDHRRERRGEGAHRSVLRAWYVESMAVACLENMSDDGVLEGVEMLARGSNEITAELLAYLVEVEERGLHLREACSSLFAFCVARLHMSEAAAGKRITATRTARRFPRVLETLAGGDPPDCDQPAGGASHGEESRRATCPGAASGQARPRQAGRRDRAAAGRRVADPWRCRSRSGRPRRRQRGWDSRYARRSALRGRSARPAAAGVGLEVRAPERARNAVVAPLSPRGCEIRVTVDEETHDELRQLQDLWPTAAGATWQCSSRRRSTCYTRRRWRGRRRSRGDSSGKGRRRPAPDSSRRR